MKVKGAIHCFTHKKGVLICLIWFDHFSACPGSKQTWLMFPLQCSTLSLNCTALLILFKSTVNIFLLLFWELPLLSNSGALWTNLFSSTQNCWSWKCRKSYLLLLPQLSCLQNSCWLSGCLREAEEKVTVLHLTNPQQRAACSWCGHRPWTCTSRPINQL